MNKYWSFYIFNIHEFRAWKKGLPEDDKAKIDLFISRLEMIQTWPPKLVRHVSGYRKIYELRIFGNKVVYRPLGCYGPKRNQFTILFPMAIEKGNKFEPHNAPKRAQERRVFAKKMEVLNEYEYDETEESD